MTKQEHLDKQRTRIAKIEVARENRRLQKAWVTITDDMIRIKAYDIYCRTGCPDSEANWLLAEKLLKARS